MEGVTNGMPELIAAHTGSYRLCRVNSAGASVRLETL